jgi:hypothetical protein
MFLNILKYSHAKIKWIQVVCFCYLLSYYVYIFYLDVLCTFLFMYRNIINTFNHLLLRLIF